MTGRASHPEPTGRTGGQDHQGALLQAVLLAVPELVYVIDLRAPPDEWSLPVSTDLLGWSREQLEQRAAEPSGTPVHPDDRARLEGADHATRKLADGAVVETRLRMRHAQGGYRLILRRTTPLLRDDDLPPIQAVATARDITQATEPDRELTRAALHDPLTGLPNRSLLLDRLDTALRRHRRGGQAVPVLFCDLDGLKRVNDSAGHRAGDAVLVATAQRLVHALRPQDTVARVGSDEFVIVLETAPPTASNERALEHADTSGVARPDSGSSTRPDTLVIVERLVAALREPITVQERETISAHTISVSIGVTFAEPGSEPEQILQQADSAMYRAKSAGKDRYAVLDSGDRAEAVERSHIERALRAALQRDLATPDTAHGHFGDRRSGGGVPGTEQAARLSVAYQPVFDLTGMQLIGVEALARLTDHYGLPLPPEAFIPVAEQTGLIGRLGQGVLTTACQDLAAWHAHFPNWRHLRLAVNLSARQAGLGDLVELVNTALDHSGLAPSVLTLELTESVLLEAGRSTITTLNALCAQGVQLAIDDFGTGYTSMSYLAQLPVSSVKVDKSFTAGLPQDPTCTVIVRTIATLAADLGLSCVVEGIETAEQLHALPAGVHGQGFLLGRPLAAAALSGLLNAAPHGPAHASTRRRRVPSRVPRTPQPASGPVSDWPSGHATTARQPQTSGHFRTEHAIDRETAADERQDTADHRDQLADRRDVLADRREQVNAQHALDLDALLADAQHRDHLAESRDLQAHNRDQVASRRGSGPDSNDANGNAERSLSSRDRVHARMDRMHAARDRDSAAQDRRGLLEERSTAQADQSAAAKVRREATATRTAALAMRKPITGRAERGHDQL